MSLADEFQVKPKGISLLRPIAFILLVLSAVQADAVTYYIDNVNGADENVGTSQGAPWRTFKNVTADIINPGDEFLLRRGRVWRETLEINAVGTEELPIIFASYPANEDDPPKISCLDEVNNKVEHVGAAADVGRIVTYRLRHIANPSILLINGARYAKANADEIGAVWWQRGRDIYIHQDNISDVLEISARRTGIRVLSSEHILIKNIAVEGCDQHYGKSLIQGAGVLIGGGSKHISVQDVVVTDCVEGIRVEGLGDNGEVNEYIFLDNVEVNRPVNQGIAFRSMVRNSRITNCAIKDLAAKAGNLPRTDKEAISLGGNTGNPGKITVEGCVISNIGTEISNGVAIAVFNTPNVTLKNNIITSVGQNAIVVGSNNRSKYAYRSDNVEIRGNSITGTGLSAASKTGQGIAIAVSDYGSIDRVTISNNDIQNCNIKDNKGAAITLRGVKNIDGSVNSISNVEIRNNNISFCKGNYARAFYEGGENIVQLKNIDFSGNIKDFGCR